MNISRSYKVATRRKDSASNNEPQHGRRHSRHQNLDFNTRYLTLENKKHATEFVKNCKEISKLVVLNYNNGPPKMFMYIKDTEERTITVHETPEQKSRRVHIFILEKKHK